MSSPLRKLIPSQSMSAEIFSSADEEQCVYPNKQGYASSKTSADDDQKQSPQNFCINSTNYSKLFRQKEMKLVKISEKLKVCQKQLQSLRIKSENNENDLLFFKFKLEQQFEKNQRIESHFELLNKTLIKAITFMTKKCSKSHQNDLLVQKKLAQFQKNHHTEGLTLSQNILSLFKKQYDLFTENFDEKMPTFLNSSTSFANQSNNNHSLFTFKGENSVQKIEFTNNETDRLKNIPNYQSQRLITESKTFERQSIEQALSSNGVEVEDMVDFQGKFSIKSLSKFKMAQLCFKLSKKIKQLEFSNKNLKLRLQQSYFKEESSPVPQEKQKITKKGGLRRIISMRQQI